MRPGQNKRMRGRNNNNNNNRRGPNPLTRSYESNGPDVKIRGTAHHIGEKYLQLARDAQSSGDPVMAESYLQHAEHYFRLIASAQLAQQQAQFGYQRQPGDAIEQDDDGDDDFESLPDRFASPSERVAQAPQMQQPLPQAQQPQPYEGRSDRAGGDRSAYDNRGNNHSANNPQGDRQGYDNRPRQYGDRGGWQDRNGQDRTNQDRTNQDRNGYDRAQERNGQDRNGQDRTSGETNGHEQRGQGDRAGGERVTFADRQGGGGRDDRPSRDYDNRNFRHRRDDRSRDTAAVSQPRLPVPDEQPVVGLPAFITAPTRVPVAEAVEAPQPTIAAAPETVPALGTGDEGSFPMRPRRRRRPKAEFGAPEVDLGEAAPPSSAGEAD